MRTLLVNTYAGSLLLGAQAVPGSRLLGSFEDCGFGAAITKANRARFTEAEPDFQFVDHIKQWPDLDLSDDIILAHPPCAAFSQQNTSASKRGINTDAFECTRKVLKYGMSNNVAAMAIESVPGALAGAWDVYDSMAEAGGYHVYRIMKNSILFGVPQFRERFWAVLVRKGVADVNMTWRLSPRYTTISSTIDHLLPGTPIAGLDKTITKFVMKLVNERGLDEAEVRRIGFPSITGHKRQGFSLRIQRHFFPILDVKFVCRNYVSPFTSAQPSLLAPYGYAPVLLGSSLWVYQGLPIPEEGYKAIMGFPADYIFPPDKHYGIRTMLSKGVCPPVATWILDNLRMHLGAESATPFTAPGGHVKVVEPGRIASFRPSKTMILERLAEMEMLESPESTELIPLRDEEEHLEA